MPNLLEEKLKSIQNSIHFIKQELTYVTDEKTRVQLEILLRRYKQEEKQILKECDIL